MIFEFWKYKDIDAFINNTVMQKTPQKFSIINQCGGLNDDYSFNDNCFACLFCVLQDNKRRHMLFNRYMNDFQIAGHAFEGEWINLPRTSSLSCKFKSLESFTKIDERKNIQPWTCAVLAHTASTYTRCSMEIPIEIVNRPRPGRLDVACTTEISLIAIETKISIDDALTDERFVEQYINYTKELDSKGIKYIYITLFGGRETDMYPENSKFCTGIDRSLSKSFYDIVMRYNIKFISANALWCLCYKYLCEGNKYAWDNFLINLFSEYNSLGLLTAGKVIRNKDNEPAIVPLLN